MPKIVEQKLGYFGVRLEHAKNGVLFAVLPIVEGGEVPYSLTLPSEDDRVLVVPTKAGDALMAKNLFLASVSPYLQTNNLEKRVMPGSESNRTINYSVSYCAQNYVSNIQMDYMPLHEIIEAGEFLGIKCADFVFPTKSIKRDIMLKAYNILVEKMANSVISPEAFNSVWAITNVPKYASSHDNIITDNKLVSEIIRGYVPLYEEKKVVTQEVKLNKSASPSAYFKYNTNYENLVRENRIAEIMFSNEKVIDKKVSENHEVELKTVNPAENKDYPIDEITYKKSEDSNAGIINYKYKGFNLFYAAVPNILSYQRVLDNIILPTSKEFINANLINNNLYKGLIQ